MGAAMYEKDSETVTLHRDCLAVAVPQGVEIELPKGTVGSLVQALGGSFTVYVRGKMFRINGEDADALGKKSPPPLPELPPGASDEELKRLIWEQMKTCFDPEIPVNVVDLGLIYRCHVEKQEDDSYEVFIEMTLTVPSCGMGDVLAQDVKQRVELIPSVTAVHVKLVFEPPWTRERMSDLARLETGLY
jgi:probable FeS assembly SUF system protein SufT